MSDIAKRLENEVCLTSRLDWQEHVALAREAAAELSRLTALVEHLKADRIRISEEAEAEIARLKGESKALKASLSKAWKELYANEQARKALQQDALRAGKLAGLERAATLAESRWRNWDADSDVLCDVTACEEIAAAIRALKEKQP